MQLDGPVGDVPRPDGVIVLATDRDAVRHDGPVRSGPAAGGRLDTGTRPSQQSRQSRGGQITQDNGPSNVADVEMGARPSQQSTHGHAGPKAISAPAR